MEENADRHHRPRTTQQMADRAKAVVAGAFDYEPDHFHDAISVLVGYIEIEAGDYPDCPYCGHALKQHDDMRFKCGNHDCRGPPYVPWAKSLGLNANTEEINVSSPLNRSGTTPTHHNEQNRFGQSDYPF